jgi:zinc protease
MSALLTGGSAGRLSRRLITDEQTCVFARTGRDRQRDGTVFWAAAAIRPGADSAKVEASVVREVERLAAEPIEGEELDRTRRQLEVALLLGRQSAGDIGQVLGTAQMVAGDWQDADRQLARLRALTPADIQQAAVRALAAPRRAVVWLTAAAPAAGKGAGR